MHSSWPSQCSSTITGCPRSEPTLLELAGHLDQAREQYSLAARTTLNLPEKRYLEARVANLDPRTAS